jgi:hypothetical protein
MSQVSASQPALSRMTGPLCGTAAILIVLSQILRLGVGLIFGRESASTTTHAITYTFALLGMGALLLALTALYAREAPTLGPLGRAGYLTAFLGTLLVAGDWWFEAFVVPTIATQAPQILAGAPGGTLLAGVVATIIAYTAGWTLFGIALYRSGIVARSAAILLIVGGLAGALVLSTPWQIPLAVAVGWIGVSRRRRSPLSAEVSARRPRTE